MKTYQISVNYCGFIGCDEIYEIEASSEEEAREEALQMAIDDLSFDVIDVIDEE